MLIALVAGYGFLMPPIHAKPQPASYLRYDYYENDGEIRSILRITHRNVHDCDLDGKVNCCDYSMQFKKEWDKMFSPYDCELVRNYWKKAGAKKPVMNHLFVRVRLTPGGKWLYVEPQAKYDSSSYKMEDYWGKRYNSRYNQYGETTYWLNTWRR